jgi:hypothetical protein
MVKALITEQGAPDIKIDFKLRLDKKTKQWKAFDMVIEGISLISAKQAEISSSRSSAPTLRINSPIYITKAINDDVLSFF